MNVTVFGPWLSNIGLVIPYIYSDFTSAIINFLQLSSYPSDRKIYKAKYILSNLW